VATATSADPTPRTAPWIALAKSDVHRIRETIPERAGSLLLVWTELLCIANETGTVSPSATRGTVAKAAGLSLLPGRPETARNAHLRCPL
jgi:hypothetical protein